VIKDSVVIKEFVVIMHCGCRPVAMRGFLELPPLCMIPTG
jgi:hypothetical protein